MAKIASPVDFHYNSHLCLTFELFHVFWFEFNACWRASKHPSAADDAEKGEAGSPRRLSINCIILRVGVLRKVGYERRAAVPRVISTMSLCSLWMTFSRKSMNSGARRLLFPRATCEHMPRKINTAFSPSKYAALSFSLYVHQAITLFEGYVMLYVFFLRRTLPAMASIVGETCGPPRLPALKSLLLTCIIRPSQPVG